MRELAHGLSVPYLSIVTGGIADTTHDNANVYFAYPFCRHTDTDHP